MERLGGFVISVYDQRHIEDNAEESYGPNYSNLDDRIQAITDGFVTDDGEITTEGWDQLSDDITKLETNSVKWLKQNFEAARADGHDSYDDLVGTPPVALELASLPRFPVPVHCRARCATRRVYTRRQRGDNACRGLQDDY